MNGAPADMLEDLRPAAFAVAYRMLGSVSEAEDIAQEAMVRSAQRDGGAASGSSRRGRGWPP